MIKGELIHENHLYEGEMCLTYKKSEEIRSEMLEIPQGIINNFKTKLEEHNLYVDDDSIITEIVSGLIKGNIIIQGPPGTGKTAISQVICEVFNTQGITVTAIDDWTTYDTIGGLFPTVKNGKEVITGKNGRIIDSIVKCCNTIITREKKQLSDDEKKELPQATWLIIDELNRAEIDKVFGDLFTVLGSGDTTGNANIPLWFQDIPEKQNITVPNRYRIIGLMNNVDKNFVYDLSQALSRRFTFVSLLPPQVGKMTNEINTIKQALIGRIVNKVSKYGEKDITDELISNKILGDEIFTEYENILVDVLKHIRYEKENDDTEGYLDAQIGSALIKDLYETIIIRLIVEEFVDKEKDKREVLLKKAIDGAVASHMVPQIESQQYELRQGFIDYFSSKKEWEWLSVTRQKLTKMIM